MNNNFHTFYYTGSNAALRLTRASKKPAAVQDRLNGAVIGGMYWLTLVDWYCASFTVIVICFCQICIFSYIYGTGRIIQDFQLMIGRRISYVWWIIWMAVTPPVLLCILANTALGHSGAGYRGRAFPTWAQSIGWVMVFASILLIPAYFLYYFCCRTAGSFRQRMTACLSPSPAWGPAQETHRQEWHQYRLKHPLRHRLIHPDLCATETSTSPDDVLLNTL
ncbi:sodium- and chloride-dependent glycine transporter 1-like [Penaeus chinensis]|uniref:sodium- and chloride-dependent glycine transporter 1-like n=1 Tax=Penaeus chinensis TaxID=139456 RepID=UPI001FB673EE|nr:sodium- and chloride-dependent glycine transporter 1-like [Penaeus chinensis]